MTLTSALPVSVKVVPVESQVLVVLKGPLSGLRVRATDGSVVMVTVEPDCSPTMKLLVPTVIDSMLALDPETLRLNPATFITVLVVSVTSLKAAKATIGDIDPIAIPYIAVTIINLDIFFIDIVVN